MSLGQLIDKLKVKGIPDSISILVRLDKPFHSLKNNTLSLALSTSLPDWGKAERMPWPKKSASRNTQVFWEHYQTFWEGQTQSITHLKVKSHNYNTKEVRRTETNSIRAASILVDSKSQTTLESESHHRDTKGGEKKTTMTNTTKP